ncbi:MAG: protein-export chaperone SecB [Candidatus Paracaedibacteraceae bacterium]|nr:protein-export chaperone SecB [Candidatus Paracaedibacteraceae bacterium]
MATTNTATAPVATTAVRAQYIRDLSFENPNPLAIFTSENQEQPEISVGIQAKAQNLGDRNFELVLDFNVEAKRGKETMFIVELSYGAVVSVDESVAESVVQHAVMVDAAHLLFPFARNIIADMTRDGGYPPLMLAPIDFNSLYEQQNQNQAAVAH